MSQHGQEKITVSIVNHAHGGMVSILAKQLLALPEVAQLLITRNIPEDTEKLHDPRVTYIDNATPKGFGANHNAAFTHCETPFFLVLNPDVVLLDNPMPALLAPLQGGGFHAAGVTSPLAVSSDGKTQDCWRRFPRPGHLLLKLLKRSGRGFIYPNTGSQSFAVDWASGLCLVFKSEVFAELQGFDEGYFLYYEDVDICARAWRSGYAVVACPDARLIHDGQRASWRQWRHFRWHVASLLRYLLKYWGRLPKRVNN
jgi:N-acetylglucosaminyl-diphospho-decaprenol L-rhamnosyltransferase